MTSKKIKITITSVILSIIAVVASPFQTKAIGLNIDVQAIDQVTNPQIGVKIDNGGIIWSRWWKPFKTGAGQGMEKWIKGIEVDFGSEIGLDSKSYLEMSISISNFTRSGVNMDALMNVSNASCTDYNIIDIQMNTLSDQTGQIKMIFKPTFRQATYKRYFYFLSNETGCSDINFIYLWTDTVFSVNYLTHYKTTETDQNQVVSAINNINNQQTQAGNQAQTDANNAGNQAQTDANNNTAPLFTTIGNILGAITDTPAGDCNINGNMGNIDLGNLNLCQAEIDPIRPIIQAVLYLVMALATYKILMWVIGSIAGLINWVQTGQEGKETNG